MEKNKIKGGLADNMSLSDIAKKHDKKGYYHIDDFVKSLKKQLQKGIKVELEHTDDENVAREIAMDHLYEDPKYYDKLKKIEAHEMDSSSSGSVDAPAFSRTILKKDIYKPKEQEIDEMTGSDVSAGAAFDAPAFGGTKGRKNPLSIGGVGTIATRANTINKTKSFPKFGGPDAKFVTINPKCKKFPYCNQGDPKAISIHEDKELFESIKQVSLKYGIPMKELETAVINEIKQIFI
jgi:hypothetical protein